MVDPDRRELVPHAVLLFCDRGGKVGPSVFLIMGISVINQQLK